MIYRGSLDDSGSTWTNNVILGNASSSTVGSDTLGYNGSGVDVFASAATSDDSSFTSNISLNPGITRPAAASRRRRDRHSASQAARSTGIRPSDGGGISAEDGSTLSVSGGTFDGNQAGDGGGAILAGDQHQRDCGQLLIHRQ